MTLSKTSASIAPRLAGIDLFRILAIFAVIVLHATPSLSTAAQPGQVDWSNLSHQAARFAVPFFFTVSGYFWATKALAPGGPVEPTIKMLKKLGSLFLAWSVFYSLVIDYRGAFDHGVTGPLKLIVWNLRSYAAHPLKLVLEGTQSHLWFLPALMCCVAISCAFLHFKFERLLIIGAALMYCVGLAGKAYSHTPLGFISDFNFRDGPFFGLIFFVSGYLLWARKVRAWRMISGVALLGAGLALSVYEVYLLHRYWNVATSQDYVASTYLYGLGVTMLALSVRPYFVASVQAVAPLVLGIYALHYVFVQILQHVGPRLADTAAGSAACVATIFVASVLSAKIMAAVPILRRMVA